MDIFLEPNKPKSKILFVGEGNFSFSRCLVENSENINENITVTCFEAESDQNESTKENINVLKNHGIQVMFGIDATKLNEIKVIWDKIIFMFPHIGGKMKIQKNRDLLKNFALCTQKVLENDGKVIVTLCDGQGGTPYDNIKRLEADSWQILKMMSYGSFGLVQALKLQLEQYPGYKPFGYRSQDKGFHVEQATVHIFQKFPPITIQNDQISKSMICAPKYQNDLSFWITDGKTEVPEDIFREIINKESKYSVIKVDLIDKYFSEQKGLHSQTHRLTYFNEKFVISPNDVMILHYSIGSVLTKHLNINIR